MTSRERSYYKPVKTQMFEIVNNAGPINTYGPFIEFSEHGIMTDIVDDRFHARVRDGEVFNNACKLTVSRKQVSNHVGAYRWYKVSDPSIGATKTKGNSTLYMLDDSGGYKPELCEAAVPTFDHAGLAKHHALANVDSTPYEFFEDLMEIKETLQFLRNPIKSLHDLVKTYNRRKERLVPRGTNDYVKRIADIWSTYRFAAAPLMRSILDLMEVLATLDDIKRPARRSAHGFAQAKSEAYKTYGAAAGSGSQERVNNYIKRSSHIIDGHASIYYEVSNPIVDLNFALGLRGKDIPVVMWEVLPLSFMVDRLLDVKGTLQGLLNLADPTISLLAASYTTKSNRKSQVEYTGTNYTYNVYATEVKYNDYVEWTEFEYERNPWDAKIADTVPPITWTNVVNDLTKILDLLAITTQRLL